MQPPKLYTSRVKELNQVTPFIYYLKLGLENPPELNFEPGQFVSIKVNQTAFRSYSIASSAKLSTEIGLYISTVSRGFGSCFIESLKLGDSVTFIGPSGRFLLAPELAQRLYFVCTSTGVTPFLSMFERLADTRYSGEVRLLFGVRSKKDVFALAELGAVKSRLANFNYTICLSQDKVDASPYVYGRVTDRLRAVSDEQLKAPQFYLCGNPNMVKDAINILTGRGVLESAIFHEKFV